MNYELVTLGQLWMLRANDRDNDPYFYVVIGLRGTQGRLDDELLIIHNGDRSLSGTTRMAGSFFDSSYTRRIA